MNKIEDRNNKTTSTLSKNNSFVISNTSVNPNYLNEIKEWEKNNILLENSKMNYNDLKTSDDNYDFLTLSQSELSVFNNTKRRLRSSEPIIKNNINVISNDDPKTSINNNQSIRGN